ncbi:MAG: PIN domain-containing protein [Azoarcus sp.]|jgi:predicted nucleic acid-binding protein|nr:PIN domain-containing protein [Azoarcus sp.]
MTRRILPDANLLIGAFDGEPDNPEHEAAYQRVKDWLLDPDVKLSSTTPLVLYEVLRGVRRVSVDEMETRLKGFDIFDVHAREARRAVEIFRFAKDRSVPLDKRSFDVFHCVCAEINGLEIASQDGDIGKIQQLIQDNKQNA